MELFLVSLKGNYTVTYKIVTKEVFNWINTGHYEDKDEFKKMLIESNFGKRKVFDKLDPFHKEIIQNSMKEAFEKYSPSNDRAILAPVVFIEKEKLYFSRAIEMQNAIKKHNIDLIKEYNGFDY